ncbi:hypothetical protein DV704_08080 [Meiothermus sp. QL-1]|uniref:hypothetical protein n=1 Tax=Meiothermus sp. QL-1 TaxID=2058095 RepID=UPI000E0AF89C|nr:hypothetical protein [Meiothermus sp. QL-1]RDI95257.1 hypothetical protein DV704_08080 [Meiothermus sp. QL-1]
MPGIAWLVLLLVAAWISAQVVLRPSLWRTQAPALGEVFGVWAILTGVLTALLLALAGLLAPGAFPFVR